MIDNIQYRGNDGISQLCIDAVVELIHAGYLINKVMLLTSGSRHAFLLNIRYIEIYVAIKSGFTSGYNGEGPKALAYTLGLLRKYCDDIDEYVISDKLMNRLNNAQLKEKDLDNILSLMPIRPQSWHDYIYDQRQETHNIYRNFPSVFPMALIEPRLHNLAKRFHEDPDNALSNGYRLIEHIVKERTGIKDKIGKRLFANVFQGENSVLLWNPEKQSENEGKAQLFIGTFMTYRNRRTHQLPESNLNEDVREFLLLNELFHLEASAIERELSI